MANSPAPVIVRRVYASRRQRRLRQRRILAASFVVLLIAVLAVAAWSLAGERPDAAAAEPGTYTKVSTPRTGESKELAAWGSGGSEGAVKGIYLSAYSAGSANLEAYLKLLDRTELNAVVVDVKDVTGEVMYPSKVPLANEIG
ncbi:MAG TPA: putative glycoside hydrolase, partial [Rubrobacteraceae bacterium]|nr:putative glycoside hydrolase [Rubrobacteraceae bacterium]